MDKKIFFGIVVLLIIVVGGFFLFQHLGKGSLSSGLKLLEVTTSKTQYKQGEIVKIIVKNISSEQIEINHGIGFGIEQSNNKNWENIIIDECNCGTIMCEARPPISLNIGEIKEFEWDQKTACDNRIALSGKYRVSIYVLEKGINIYSNEFVID